MFFELVNRNSRRTRKENGLFFSAMLVAVIAFYIILSLSQQDVMFFLRKMESDAVSRLMEMIPVFYLFTLVLLFFLVYFAGRFQLERRSHELGMYLMLGMRRRTLFAMLLAEDLKGSLLALAVGLPAAILLSEMTSLVTARIVGLGIIGHRFSLSVYAVLLTAAGFLLIKFFAFLVLSFRISRREIGSLLKEQTEAEKKQFPSVVYTAAFLAGIAGIVLAYSRAISGVTWQNWTELAITLALGFSGMLLFFFGLRIFLSMLARRAKQDRRLRVFNFRQLQENVIRRSSSMAVSSILILLALCCFGAGIAISHLYAQSDRHVLDYTFKTEEMNASEIREVLKKNHLDTEFADLFEVKTKDAAGDESSEASLSMEPVMETLRNIPGSDVRDSLLRKLEETADPHLIAESGYNRILKARGLPELALKKGEAAVYMNSEFLTGGEALLMNEILDGNPQAVLRGETIDLAGGLQTSNFVTDRAVTYLFALILPDDVFSAAAGGDESVYLDGVLAAGKGNGTGLMTAISDMNDCLDKAGLHYESYLQNMGRQLFYSVAASYITIYLAVIFMIIANTVLGVQFLMGQRKMTGRYQTLVHLGATYEVLCRSVRQQADWFFGIPVAVAAVSSLFGVQALFTVFLSGGEKSGGTGRMLTAAAMILLLTVVEFIYMTAVKRSSTRALLERMVPEREE